MTSCALKDSGKAFDSIQPNILLLTLQSYGVRGIAANLIKLHLCNRHQLVYVNKISFYTLDVKYVVPQSSILGPSLFLVYINGIKNIPNSPHEVIYADDKQFLQCKCKVNSADAGK